MEDLDVQSINDAIHTGRASKQILMKNQIAQSLKKVIMKDTNIKNVVSSNKQLDDIIQETESLKGLCAPVR